EMQFQLSAGLNYTLSAIRIAFAGQLDNDFVFSLAVGSYERFGQAERVNTPPDGFLGLVHGPLLKVSNVRRFHREEVSGGLAWRRGDIPIRKLVGNKIAGGACLFGSDVVDQNLGVVQLAKLIIPDRLVAKRLGDIVEDLIGFL